MNTTTRMAEVRVLIDRKEADVRRSFGLNVFQSYICEVLDHAGMPYRLAEDVREAVAPGCDLLVVALLEESGGNLETLWNYMEHGGRVVAMGGLNPLAERLGTIIRPEAKERYAQFALPYGPDTPVRFLAASPWTEREPDGRLEGCGWLDTGREQPDRAPVIASLRIGAGRLDRWAVDVGSTVVAFQQGLLPVLQDGIPAPDGSAQVQDGILKADDGSAMDWETDRLRTETDIAYFAHPYADQWRELFLGWLVHAAADADLTLPFVERWPEGVEQVAMISFDSDRNEDASAATTLDVLTRLGVRTTWCLIEPGFGRDMLAQAQAGGHELAFHFNGLEAQGGGWSREEFDRQLAFVRSAVPGVDIVSNKNHYTCFRGWDELFRWCERGGIRNDQTRGPSKKGNTGFLFGTCLPYFPIAWFDENNRRYDVLEIGFTTQDLDHRLLCDYSIAPKFLEQVKRVGGVAHFLFHQIHIHQQEAVRKALEKLVNEARQQGFVFLTCREIGDWERARRAVKIKGVSLGSEPEIDVGQPLAGAVVTVPLPKGRAQGDELPEGRTQGDELPHSRRFGLICRTIALT